MSRVLADQPARDRIRNDLDSSLFVEASAGTGKTSALVERIVELVLSGKARPDRIAAITFTDAAGAELRDRLLVEFERTAVETGRTEEERRRCREALDLLDAAAVETLHSFAARILSLYPLEAGLPPGFEVVDEARATASFEERWAAHLDAMLDDSGLQEPLRRAFTLGLTVGDLHELARRLHDHWDRLADDAAELPPVALSSIGVAPLAAELVDISAERARCKDPEDRMFIRLLELEHFARQLEAADGDEIESLRLLSRRPSFRVGRVGRARNWPDDALREIRHAVEELEQRIEQLLETVTAEATLHLYASLRRFVLDYARERRQQGRLEFHDLLVLARDLLRNSQEARRELRRRFTHLLIDEFQDTDPLQTEIAFLLAAPGDQEVHSWKEAFLEPGRLFLVGDPKQSIYGFRRADIMLYESVKERFPGMVVELAENFRSVPAITAWVNAIVGPLMGEQPRPGQATYNPLHAHRPPHPQGVTVHLLGGPREATMERLREEEAGTVVALLQRARDDRWQVRAEHEPGEGERFRDARFQDIAILVPARTALPALLAALEGAGIPYRLESKSLVYETQEVQDLLSILRAIDDPSNEVALVAALRSPGFGCADDDLLGFIDAGGRWDYREPPPAALDASHPVVAGMAWMREVHEQSWWRSVSSTVDRVIRERRLLELGVIDRRPRERWQRLRFLLDQARAFMEAGGATLRGFLTWVEREAEDGKRVVETVVPDPDDDAVRIMTIHAAKGLEFPVVLLAGLNARRRSTAEKVLWDDAGRPEFRLGNGFTTAGYEELKLRKQQLEELEGIRLLYVAATRARDHLMVSVFHQAGAESRAASLYELAQKYPDLWQAAETAGPRREAELGAAAALEPDGPALRAEWLERVARAVDRGRAAPTVSATGLAQAFATAPDPNLDKGVSFEQEGEPWRRGRAGTSIGRAVHSVLQTIDLATGDGLESTARAQAMAEGLPQRAGEVERLARAALGSEAVQAAVSSGRYWREVYVAAPIDGVLVEGFIDLLYEAPNGLVIVDYKTDALPDGDAVDSAVTRYRPQGAAYALALSEALARPVARCVFVFLDPAGATERGVEDLAAAMSEVREQLAGTRPRG